MNSNKKTKKGFTFVELLVVITIIGILFASGIVGYGAITKRTRNARRKADLEAIRQALEMCRSLKGDYPVSIAGSVTCTGGSPVLLTKTPEDPKGCGTPAVYTYSYTPNATFTTYTLSAPCMAEDGEAGYEVTNP